MSKNIENLNLSNNEGTFKITELKERFQIEVSEEELKKYKDAIFSMKQIQKIKDGKDTVSEIASINLENLKKKFQNGQKGIEASLEKSSQIRDQSESEAKEALDEVEKNIDGLSRSESAEKAKKVVSDVKAKANDIKDEVGKEGLMIWLEKKEKEGGIMGFLVGLLLGIARFFGYKNKLGEAAEVLDGAVKKLSPEKLEEVKDKTKKIIIEGMGGGLTQENQGKLDKSIESLSKEQLNSLYEKLQKGELSFGEIGKIVPGILKDIVSPEQIEKTKNDIQSSIVETLKKEIKEKYNIDLDDGKLAKLKELVEKNTKIDEKTIALFYDIGEKKSFQLKDFFSPSMEIGININSIMIGLLVNGIVPVSAFGMDFAKSGTDAIKFSIDALGIGSQIDISTFNESIKGMSDSQKGILIGLLYRKGGLFLNMIGSIGESISRLGVEFLTGTQIKGYQTLGAGLSGNYGRQAELFGKITKTISPETYKDADDILKKANDAFKKLEENYKIIDILQKSDGNVETATKLLKEAKIQIPTGIDISDFNKFVEGFKPGMEHTFEGLSKGAISSKLGFGASADLYELESKIQKITQAQRRLLNGNFLVKGIAKLRELGNIGEVSRLGDRMVLHFESKDEAIKGISKWNILANKFPEIVKGSLDKLPIIAVAGIAINSDKPFFEELKKEMFYLFPILGPILLIGEGGLDWENGKPKITNGIEAGIGGVLLAVDGVFLIKEISKSGLKGGGSYIIKPIKDIYSIGRGTAEGAYSIGKAALNGKSISGALKESITKSKSIKNTKTRALAVIGLIGYAGYSYAFEDDSLKEVFDKNGKMDKEKLKSELPNLDDKEKTICFKYIIAETMGDEFIKNLGFEIVNNKLYITSSNDKIQDSWFVENSLLETLGLNPKIEFEYQKKPA